MDNKNDQHNKDKMHNKEDLNHKNKMQSKDSHYSKKNVNLQNESSNNNKNNILLRYIIVSVILIGLAIGTYSIMRGISINRNQNNSSKSLSNLMPTATSNKTTTTTPITPTTSTPSITPSLLTNNLPTTAPTITQTPVTKGDNGVIDVDVTHTPAVVKGIYVTASSAGSRKINNLITLAGSTEVNAFVIDVKGDNGRISYKMNNAMVKQIGANTNTISDIKVLTRKLKSKNIYLIARVVAFKDPYLAEQRHDLAINNKDGSLYRDNNKQCWVNPYNKEVWNYLVGVATQAAKDGFDEIQFDYIRFSTGEGIKKADFGEEEIKKSKEQIITEFTKYAYNKLHPLGVYVSADVYGTIINSKVDSKIVGQNYQKMAQYLDYICPMIYPSHFGEGNYGIQYPDTEPYSLIYKVLMKSEEKLEQLPKKTHKAIVRPWLQDFTASWVPHHIEYGGTEVRAQIKGVYAAGYGQWLLWNSGCSYSESGLLDN